MYVHVCGFELTKMLELSLFNLDIPMGEFIAILTPASQ